MQVRHVSGVPAVEPLAEVFQLGMVGHGGDAAEIEAKLARLRFDVGRSHRGHRQRITNSLLHTPSWKARDRYLATSCRRTYGRMPPCLNATSSSGVSMRTTTLNSLDRPLPSPACTAIVAPGFSPSATPAMVKTSRPLRPRDDADCPL